MPINLDLRQPHKIIAANSHYYKTPTEVLYIDRVMPLHDLIYLVDGSWVITENEVEYPLDKGDVLLLAAGRHHYTRHPCLPETRTICIHVTSERNDNPECEHSLTLPTHLQMKNQPNVRHYFEEIVATLWSENPRKQERMSALFNLLILELADAQDARDQNRGTMVEEIIRIVNATPHRRYKVGEVAEMLYMSEKTLQNTMRQEVGVSFSEYQMNRKLEMVAVQLEIEPDMRLKEISALFGFCDEFHMSKAFKKKYGVSPNGYKALKRAEYENHD